MRQFVRLAIFAAVFVSSSFPATAFGQSKGSNASGNCPAWRPCGPGETWCGNRFIPQTGLGIDARPVCQKHDDCYDTAGVRRKDCDVAFLNELKCLCESSDHPRACKRRARLAYLGVRLFGGSSPGS